MPFVDKLIKEGKKIEKLETWHNEENAKLNESFDKGLCGGVPFFYNTESKQFICGEGSEEDVHKWANGEKLK